MRQSEGLLIIPVTCIFRIVSLDQPNVAVKFWSLLLLLSLLLMGGSSNCWKIATKCFGMRRRIDSSLANGFFEENCSYIQPMQTVKVRRTLLH